MAPGITDESVYMLMGKLTESHQQTAGNINAHHDRITKLEEDIISLLESGGSGSTLTGQDGISITNDVITVDFSHSGFNTDNISEAVNLYYTDARVLDTLNNATSVGIGEADPSNKLHVNSGSTNIAAQFESTDATGGIMLKDSTGNVELTTSGTHGFNIHPNGGAAVFRVEANGDVGIGVIQPNAKLDVRGGTSSGTNTHAVFSGTNNRGLSIQTSRTGQQNDGKVILNSQDTDAGGASMDFQIAGTTRMEIENSGNLNVNTENIFIDDYTNIGRTVSGAMSIFGHNTKVTTVENQIVAKNKDWYSHFIKMYYDQGISFHVSPNASTSAGEVLLQGSGTNSLEAARITPEGHVLIGNTTIINSGATSFLSVGDGLGSAAISIYSGVSSYGYLNFARGSSGAAADPGYIRYNHNDDSFLFGAASGGSVHIGTGGAEANGTRGGVTFSNDTNDRKNLICATTSISDLELIEFRNPNGTIGTIKSNGQATTFNTSSDYRLKENVNYEWDASTRLKQLKPARFNFKTENDTVDGFLAHEVSDIVPNAVSGEKDGEKMQSIDHSKLVPLLVKALQEQQKQIDELKSELHALKSQNK